MPINIQHTTEYTYTGEVFPRTHYLFFRPMNRPYIRLLNFDIQVDPVSSGLAGRLDAENNVYYQLWYLDKIKHLTIDVTTQVELNPFNPFDFLIDPPFDIHKPVEYESSRNALLVPYLETTSLSGGMKQYIDQAFDQASGSVLDFFLDINQAISRDWDHEIRLEENIHSPVQCFDQKAGSCRDLSWMLMNMLRSKGFASRFVSGYSYVPGMTEGHELHAWLEVLLPGAGWLAMDPTLGLLVTEQHIPIAASYDPIRTLPVQGSYHGDAHSKMETRVVISEID